ncbi:MAG: dienelactone hydrolase family protein [Ilumatobacteraceae bacterium]
METVQLPGADGAVHDADLTIPPAAVGLVVFAHGSGSSRQSPRNRMVAGALNDRHLATLLVDLLTIDEEAAERRGARLRFDVDQLAVRLGAFTREIHRDPRLVNLPIGYFGASTGAAAALVATAIEPDGIAAIVSRGGRPDLAGSSLRVVQAPTLLLVGARDEQILELNRQAQTELAGPSELIVVPGASHLFEEPGALEEVAQRAGDWLLAHVSTPS